MGVCQLKPTDRADFIKLLDKICGEQDVVFVHKDDESVKLPIKFKDAFGRKFGFPWSYGMEELITQAHLRDDIIRPHVRQGHYDLVGPNGEIIPPQIWETTIQPDWQITMHMWPMPEPPLKVPHGHSNSGFPPPPPPDSADFFSGSYPSRRKKRSKRDKVGSTTFYPSPPPPPSAPPAPPTQISPVLVVLKKQHDDAMLSSPYSPSSSMTSLGTFTSPELPPQDELGSEADETHTVDPMAYLGSLKEHKI